MHLALLTFHVELPRSQVAQVKPGGAAHDALTGGGPTTPADRSPQPHRTLHVHVKLSLLVRGLHHVVFGPHQLIEINRSARPGINQNTLLDLRHRHPRAKRITVTVLFATWNFSYFSDFFLILFRLMFILTLQNGRYSQGSNRE